ncbi:MAG: acyl carrier protein [Nitrospirota bacterium]|nr:acyl carrier protein [Nitrospirota bacterium]
MTKNEIKDLIVRTLKLSIRPEDISDGASLNADIGLDSINALELATALEEKYDLTIDDNEIYKILTSVDSIFEHVNLKTGGKSRVQIGL